VIQRTPSGSAVRPTASRQTCGEREPPVRELSSYRCREADLVQRAGPGAESRTWCREPDLVQRAGPEVKTEEEAILDETSNQDVQEATDGQNNTLSEDAPLPAATPAFASNDRRFSAGIRGKMIWYGW
jgi:hypothetical protein